MPKFVYDKKTGNMVIDKPKGLEFNMLVKGLKVTDHDLKTSFVIDKSTDNIEMMQGVVRTHGVKIFDYRRAYQIAQMVRRCMPNSVYSDYKKFCRGIKESDKQSLQYLISKYSQRTLLESIAFKNSKTSK